MLSAYMHRYAFTCTCTCIKCTLYYEFDIVLSKGIVLAYSNSISPLGLPNQLFLVSYMYM